MDFSNFANMKMSDFENIGKDQYNKGFAEALSVVVKLLSAQICEDFNADGKCEHDRCMPMYELSEGIAAVRQSV
jgi:hypothetical protein